MFGHQRRLERDFKDGGGTRAWATILESRKGRTTTGGVNAVAGQAGSITMRREFRLRVEPQDDPAFEATVRQSFNDVHGWPMPDVGWSVTVIYDAHDHAKVIIDVDAMPVRPGADREATLTRHERALQMHRQSGGAAAATSGPFAEQWRAIALDPTLSPEEKRAKVAEIIART